MILKNAIMFLDFCQNAFFLTNPISKCAIEQKRKSNDLPGCALTVNKTIHSIENECNKTKAVKEQCKTRIILGKKI